MALAGVPAYLFAVFSDTLTFHTSHTLCNALCHCQLQRNVRCGLSQQKQRRKIAKEHNCRNPMKPLMVIRVDYVFARQTPSLCYMSEGEIKG